MSILDYPSSFWFGHCFGLLHFVQDSKSWWDTLMRTRLLSGLWLVLENINKSRWTLRTYIYIYTYIMIIIYIYIWASIARYLPPPPTPWLWVCIVAPQYHPPPCGVGGGGWWWVVVGGGGWWCTPLPPVVWVVWVVVGGGGRSCICMYMNVSVPPSPLWCGWCGWWWKKLYMYVYECIWWYECMFLVFAYDYDMICIW